MEIHFSSDSSLRKIVKGLLRSSVPRSKVLSCGNSVHRLSAAQVHINLCARLRCKYLLVAPPRLADTSGQRVAPPRLADT